MSFASFFPSLTRRSFTLSALAAPLSYFTTRTTPSITTDAMSSTSCWFVRPGEYRISFPTPRQARQLERESVARYGRDAGLLRRAGNVLVWIEPVHETIPVPMEDVARV